ncbi:hypothetical protein [Calothrix sp. 336/3]|uniref:hypothetical protein n=1 Tax=Calothrix sp. 336/3 TaxID=1337936 RepID=UPI000AD14911|nr:hypothetical protein [Calothrix sp. 336/3]
MKKYRLVAIFIISCIYFLGVSGLGVNDFYKGQMVLFPIQISAAIYMMYFRRWNVNRL